MNTVQNQPKFNINSNEKIYLMVDGKSASNRQQFESKDSQLKIKQKSDQADKNVNEQNMQLTMNSQKEQDLRSIENKLNDYIQQADENKKYPHKQDYIVLQQKQLVIPIEQTVYPNKKQFKSRANQYLQIVSFQDKDKIDQSKSTIRIAENSLTSSNHESMHFKKSFNEINPVKKTEIPWIKNNEKKISDYTPLYIQNNSKILINSNSEDAIVQSYNQLKNVPLMEDIKNQQQLIHLENSYEDSMIDKQEAQIKLNQISSKNISVDLLKQQVSLADKDFQIDNKTQQINKDNQQLKIRYVQIDQDQLISQLQQIDDKLIGDITNEIMLAERKNRSKKTANIQKSIMPIYARSSDEDKNSQSPTNNTSPIVKANLQKKIQLVKKFINQQINNSQTLEKKSIQLASYFQKKSKKINDFNFDQQILDKRYQSLDVDNEEIKKQKQLMFQFEQIIQKQTPRFQLKNDKKLIIQTNGLNKINTEKAKNSPYKRQTIQELVYYDQNIIDEKENLNLMSSNDSQNMFKIKNSISGSIVIPKIESPSAVDEFKNAIVFSYSNRKNDKYHNELKFVIPRLQNEIKQEEIKVYQNQQIDNIMIDKNIQCSYHETLSKTVLDKSNISSNAKLINPIKIVRKNLSEGLDDDYQQRYSTESFSPYEKNLQQPALIHSPREVTETDDNQYLENLQKQSSRKQQSKNIIKPNFKMSPENILIQSDKQNNDYILFSNMRKQNSPGFQKKGINKIDLIFNQYQTIINQQTEKIKEPSPKNIIPKQNQHLPTQQDNYPESKTNSVIRKQSYELLESLAFNKDDKINKNQVQKFDQYISNSVDSINLRKPLEQKLQNVKSSYKQYQFKVKNEIEKKDEKKTQVIESENNFKLRPFVKLKKGHQSIKQIKSNMAVYALQDDKNIIIQQTNNPSHQLSNIIVGINPQKIEKKIDLQQKQSENNSETCSEKDQKEVKVVHSINYKINKKFNAFATLNNENKQERKLVKMQELKLLDDWKNGKQSNYYNNQYPDYQIQSPVSYLSSDICNIYQDQCDQRNRAIIDQIQEEALHYSSLEQSISLFNIQNSSTSKKLTDITFEDQKLFIQKLINQNSKEMLSNPSSKFLKYNQNQVNYVNLNEQFQVQSKQISNVIQNNLSSSPKSNQKFLLVSPSKESELIQEENKTNQQILSSQTSNNNEYMIVQKKILKQRASNSQKYENLKFKAPIQKSDINSDLNNIFDIQKELHKQIINRNLSNNNSNSSSEKQDQKSDQKQDIKFNPQKVEDIMNNDKKNTSITNFKKSSIEFIGQNPQLSKTQTQFKNSYIIDSEKYTPNDNEDSKFIGCVIQSEDLGSSIQNQQNEEEQNINNIKEESEQDESPKQILVQNYQDEKVSKAINTSLKDISSKKSGDQVIPDKNQELVLNITVNQITPQNFTAVNQKNTPILNTYLQDINSSNFQIQFSVYQQQKQNQNPQMPQVLSQKNLKVYEKAIQNNVDYRQERNSIKDSLLTSQENNLVSEEGNNNLIIDPKLSENKWITITPLNIQPNIEKKKIRQKQQQQIVNRFPNNQRIYVSQAFRKSKLSPNFMMLNTSKFSTDFPNQQIKILQRNLSKFDSFRISEIKKMVNPKQFAEQFNKQMNSNRNMQAFQTQDNQIVNISPKMTNSGKYEKLGINQNIIAQIQINKRLNGDIKIIMDQNDNQKVTHDKGIQIEQPTFRNKHEINMQNDFINRNRVTDSEMNQTMKKKLSSKNSESQVNFFNPNQISPHSLIDETIFKAYNKENEKQNEPEIHDNIDKMKSSFHQILLQESPRIVNSLDHITKIDQQQVFRQYNDISMLRKSSEEFMKNQFPNLQVEKDQRILEYHRTQFPNIQHVSQEQLKEILNKSRNYYKSDPDRSNDDDETFQKNLDRQKSNDSQKKTQYTFKDKSDFIEGYQNQQKIEAIMQKELQKNKELSVLKFRQVEISKNLQKNKNEININRVKKKQFKMAKDEIWGLDSIKQQALSYMTRQPKEKEIEENKHNRFLNRKTDLKFETQISLPMNQTILNKNMQSQSIRYNDSIRNSLQLKSISEFTDKKLFQDNPNISRDQGLILKEPKVSVYLPPIKKSLNDHFFQKKQSLKTIDSINQQLINQPIDSSFSIQNDGIFNNKSKKMQMHQQQYTQTIINNSAFDIKMNKLKNKHIRHKTDFQTKKYENHHLRKLDEIIQRVQDMEMMNESSALLVQDFTIDSMRKQMDSFELTEVKMNNTEMASIFKETLNQYNYDFQKDYNLDLSQSDK